jgi:hypothetical protein
VAIYDPDKKEYVTIAGFKDKCDAALGAAPSSLILWKAAVKVKDKDGTFGKIFADMKATDSLGARMAVEYGKNSCAIGQKLVDSGVAFNAGDVNTVLLTGFFHAYGPINGYF